MNDNVSRGIEKIVNVFKQDVNINGVTSYLYDYFEKAKRYKSLENKEKKGKEKEIIIKKKIQDFLSTNKKGRSESITAKMLLGLCEHSENCKVSLVEIFENSTSIEEDINVLESFLKERKKDALLPIKVDVDTGVTIYIRYRAIRKRLDYIITEALGDKIFAVNYGSHITDGVTFRIANTFNEAQKMLDEVLEGGYGFEGLNEFQEVDGLPARMKKYIPQMDDKKGVDEMLGKSGQTSDGMYEQM